MVQITKMYDLVEDRLFLRTLLCGRKMSHHVTHPTLLRNTHPQGVEVVPIKGTGGALMVATVSMLTKSKERFIR